MPVFGEKTPVRKSPRLNAEPVCLDTTPTQCSRPTFNLNVSTLKLIVIESSKKKDSSEGPSKSLKRKGKEKVDLANNSDFEDEIPIMKRYRLNQQQNSANVRCKSRGGASFKGDNRQPKKSSMKPKKGRTKSLKRTSVGYIMLMLSCITFEKKMKYGPRNDTRVTFMDSFFIRWVEQIHDHWLKSNKDNRVITPDHEVAQYIRGYKIHTNTSWDLVDYICILINIPNLCHWVLAVICIKSFCIYVFDSLFEVGPKQFAVVNHMSKKLTEIIPLFFICTGFYGKRDAIDWNKTMTSIEHALEDPLVYFICDNIPQQCEDSNDCGLYTCAFRKYYSQGHFEIYTCYIDTYLFRMRYGALLWQYATRKMENETVSESEMTGKVVSRMGAPKVVRDYISVSDTVDREKLVPRRKT